MRRRAPTTPRAKPPAQPKSCSVHVKLSYDDGPTAAPWFGFARKQLQRMVETGALRRVIPIGDVTITLRRVSDELGFAHIASGVWAMVTGLNYSPVGAPELAQGRIGRVVSSVLPYPHAHAGGAPGLVCADVAGRTVAVLVVGVGLRILRNGEYVAGVAGEIASYEAALSRDGTQFFAVRDTEYGMYDVGETVALQSTHSTADIMADFEELGYTARVDTGSVRFTRLDAPYIAVAAGYANKEEVVSALVETNSYAYRTYGVTYTDDELGATLLFASTGEVRYTQTEFFDGGSVLLGHLSDSEYIEGIALHITYPPFMSAQLAHMPTTPHPSVLMHARYGNVAQATLTYQPVRYTYLSPTPFSFPPHPYGRFVAVYTGRIRVQHSTLGEYEFAAPGEWRIGFGITRVQVCRGGTWVETGGVYPATRTGWWVTATAAARFDLAEYEVGTPLGGTPRYVAITSLVSETGLRAYRTDGTAIGTFSIAPATTNPGQGNLFFDVERADSLIHFSHQLRFRYITLVEENGVYRLTYSEWKGSATNTVRIGEDTYAAVAVNLAHSQILNDR